MEGCEVWRVVSVRNENVGSKVFERWEWRYVSDFLWVLGMRGDNEVGFEKGCFGWGKRR